MRKFTRIAALPRTLVIAGLASALLPVATAATTYVMMTDEELLDQSRLIAEVRILSVAAAPGPGRPAIDYQVQLDQVILGSAAAETLVVRVPGGVNGEGLGLRIWGAPRFQQSERALLFLEPHADGTYRILHLMLGAFHEVEFQGRRLAVRALTGAEVVSLRSDRQEAQRRRSHLPRDFEAFKGWLVDRVAGLENDGDYFVEGVEAALSSVASPFTLLRSSADPAPFGCGTDGGNGIRWVQFDSGGTVFWNAHQSGQAGVPGGGFTEFQAGLGAWNSDPNTPIFLTYSGITVANLGFLNPDGVNTILFDDPNNEIGGTFNGAGTLAIGGSFFSCDVLVTFNEETFHVASEAEIITQDGSSLFFSGSASPGQAAGEVFGHELGHTLGLGHSCGDSSSPPCNNTVLGEALMRAFAHNDGRGARLNSDDQDGIAFLYRPRQDSRPTPPTAPTSLFATPSSIGQIVLAWWDNSNNEAEFIVEERSAMGTFKEKARVPANTNFYKAKGITSATFRAYRVRATNAGGTSVPTNEATATTFGLAQRCVTDALTLCLFGDRFRVTADWRRPDGSVGTGKGVELTNDTGYFWFFRSTNIEVVVKVVYACRQADVFWLFAGGLTDVETVLTVEDTRNGAAQTYINPQGTPFQPVQDTMSFTTCP